MEDPQKTTPETNNPENVQYCFFWCLFGVLFEHFHELNPSEDDTRKTPEIPHQDPEPLDPDMNRLDDKDR